MTPLKLAIIGGGPSSFYVASRLLSIFPQSDALSSQLRIHIYDRLWAPHGLVRYGVAPDHPEVKVRPRASPRQHFTSQTAIELHAQVRSSRQRFPPTLLRERAGWATNRASDPPRAPDIPIFPPTALHPPPLLHRLCHTHFAPCAAALRSRYPRALVRPLVHASPVATSTSTAARDRARLDHRPGKRRAGRRAHAAHASRNARKVRRPRKRTRSPPQVCCAPRLDHRPTWTTPGSLHQ